MSDNTRHRTSAARVLSAAVSASGPLLLRYVAGFDDVTALRQFSGQPNHLRWTLGHCGLSLHRVACMIDGGVIPLSDYAHGDQEPNRDRFLQSRVCRGSSPTSSALAYPGLNRSIEIFSCAIDRLSGAVLRVSDPDLARVLPWHDGPIRLEILIHRITFHTACHAGQIIDQRRSLGLPLVIGDARAQ